MAAGVNLSGALRMFYIAAGAGLLLAGLFWLEGDWPRTIVPIAGAVILLEGVIAF